MRDAFDVFDYIDFLRARWKFAAVACGFAIAASLATSLLLPKRYTATATILIDPPAAGDPRIATAVSTVYLESLKTYELLATNDQLFLRAAGQFHLLGQGASIESLKRRVLKVDKLRDTRALQISVTLSGPHAAQAMAQFIAQGAVELSRSGGKEADEARIQDASKAADIAKARLLDVENAWQKAAGAQSAEALRLGVSDESDLKSHVEEQLLDEESGDSPGRAELLKKRISELNLSIREKSAALAQQSAREDDLQAMLTAARASYDASTQRLADLQVGMGTRSEWLRLVDPGIVPERPSSPNVPLILIGAALLALFGSWLYLTISFSLIRGRRRYDLPLRYATHGDD